MVLLQRLPPTPQKRGSARSRSLRRRTFALHPYGAIRGCPPVAVAASSAQSANYTTAFRRGSSPCLSEGRGPASGVRGAELSRARFRIPSFPPISPTSSTFSLYLGPKYEQAGGGGKLSHTKRLHLDPTPRSSEGYVRRSTRSVAASEMWGLSSTEAAEVQAVLAYSTQGTQLYN